MKKSPSAELPNRYPHVIAVADPTDVVVPLRPSDCRGSSSGLFHWIGPSSFCGTVGSRERGRGDQSRRPFLFYFSRRCPVLPPPAAGVGPDGRRRSLQTFAAVVIASVGLNPSLVDFVRIFASQAFPLFPSV
ncbi:hypothetical protein BHM03_00012849 [Ensete ventricosum]|uniref:Uncharacterized protein n=1 Tax=Ensete ventricosum TaxID=4639 RepID=A0A445MDK1_ENSVE|nr:hypothetical protein BHM03_00012849 [Ensete ventricosum]